MTEITILNLLNTRPMYGAEMIDEIKRLSGNTVIMSLPTLYSSLHRMSDKKFVRSYQKESAIGGRCRVYNITKFGRDYLVKNPIKIDYKQIADNSVKANKTFTSLEEAYSLPSTKNATQTRIDLPEEKRVIQINPTPTPKAQPITNATKTETKPSPYSPYIAPNEKITTTPETPRYQQTTIGLSGTVGGNDLRPLLNLNSISVGNDYVLINRLRFVSILITTALFMLINLIFSFTNNVCAECYNVAYLALGIYTAIWLIIYTFYPRIKAVFNLKSLTGRQLLFTLILIGVVIACRFATKMSCVLFLLIFAFYPLVRLFVMIALRKRSWFAC